LVFSVFADVDCYLLGLAAAGECFGPLSFDEGVDGVDFSLLIEDALCQFFSFAFVLPFIFLVLFQNFIAFLGANPVPFFGEMEFVEEMGVFLL
jgi:hypothetical protein